MSVTFDQLAAELHTDPQAITDTARLLLTSGEEKVLTVGPSSGDPTDPVACLTDQAAAAIRTRFNRA